MFHAFPWLYVRVHKTHHATQYVCPFSATTLHVFEHLLVGILPTILPLFIFPMTEGGWAMANLVIFIHGLFIHSNVPSPLERLGCIGTLEHATHHLRPKTNLGFMVPWGTITHPWAADQLFSMLAEVYA